MSDGGTIVTETATVNVIDTRPIARPGPERNINGGELVILEPENTYARFTYRWQQVAGTDLGLGVVDEPRLWIRAPTNATTLEFELTVSDGSTSDSERTTLVVQTYTGATVQLGDHPLIEPVVLTSHPFKALTGSGNLLVAAGDQVGENLWVVDVRDPQNPTVLASTHGRGLIGDIAFDGTRIFTIDNLGLLQSFTFVNGAIHTDDVLQAPEPYTGFVQLTLNEDMVYLAARNDNSTGVVAVDASDPSELVIVAEQLVDNRSFSGAFPPVFELAATNQFLLFAQNERERYYDITQAPAGVMTLSGSYRILDDLENVRDVVAGSDNDFITAAQEFYRHVGGTSRDGPFDYAFDLDEPGIPSGLFVSGETLVVALGFAGVGIYELESPLERPFEPEMRRRALVPTGAWTDTVAVAGGSLFAKVGPAEVVTAPLSTTNSRPSLATIRTPGNFRPTDVVAEHGRLFTSGRFGALAYNVSNPLAPTRESDLPMNGVHRLTKNGDLLIGTGTVNFFQDLVVVDVGTPGQPRLHSTVSECPVSIAATSLENRIYAACGRYGLQVLEASPDKPVNVLETFVNGNEWYRAMARVGDRLYTHRFTTTDVWDISDRNETVLLGSLRNFTQNMPWAARGNVALAPYSFSRTSSDASRTFFTVIDFSDPQNPKQESKLEGFPGYAQNLELYGDLLFAAIDSAFVAVDISDLDDPRVLTRFDAGSDARSIALDGEYLFAGEDRAFGAQNMIRVLPVEPMRLVERRVRAQKGTRIAYTVEYAGLGDSPSFRCGVTGGSCQISSVAETMFAVTWTTPATPGDYEMVIYGGQPNAWSQVADRVRVE